MLPTFQMTSTPKIFAQDPPEELASPRSSFAGCKQDWDDGQLPEFGADLADAVAFNADRGRCYHGHLQIGVLGAFPSVNLVTLPDFP